MTTAMQEKLMRRTLDWMAAAVVLVALVGIASAQSLTKMTIATGVDPAFSQFYVAKEGGLFEKNGLDVTLQGPKTLRHAVSTESAGGWCISINYVGIKSDVWRQAVRSIADIQSH